MNLPLFVSRRYLFARKSHNVINVISAISATGIAVGTAALVIILSVYNGFDNIIRSNLNDLDPDILLVPETGKFFSSGSLTNLEHITGDAEVSGVCGVLEDNVFITYGDAECVVTAKGVERSYENSPLKDHVIEGNFSLGIGDLRYCALGSALAYENGIHPRFSTPVTLYYPSDPSSSLRSGKVFPSAVFSISSDIDEGLMVVPIETMRELISHGEETFSALEIRLKNPKKVSGFIKSHRADGFRMLDRYSQHPSLYRMMAVEKAAIFLILVFVVIIVAFNIFSSLSMLRIEKEEDVKTLAALGAREKSIRRIFTLEGWLISLIGMLSGLAVGIIAVVAQQTFGIVRMPGNFLIGAYPVELQPLDVILIVLGVSAIGFVISAAAARRKYSI